MSTPGPQPDIDLFAAQRPRLFAIAYRMLGTRADAEDVLQDAWLRWHRTDREALQSPEAWLVTVVTRLAIDRLRAVQAERRHYPHYPDLWLPEPLVEPEPVDERTPEAAAELASDLSLAFLWVLERLQPEERAAFLMRQAFDRDYAEIAALLGKSEAACRQLVHRAGERVQQASPRQRVSKATHRQLLEKFVAAARSGERAAMESLLAEDVQFIGDAGGKVPASNKVLVGAHRIANLFASAVDKWPPGAVAYRLAQVNGELGVLRFIGGQLESAQAFVIDGERIAAICVVRNPDKLAHLSQGL